MEYNITAEALPLVTVAVITNWPFFGITTNDQDEVIAASGIDYQILKTLSELLRFR